MNDQDEWDEVEYEFPILEDRGDEGIPDLRRIDESRWRDALRPLSPAARYRATYSVGIDKVPMANAIRAELDLGLDDESVARRQQAPQAALPIPTAKPQEPGGQSRRQLNVRLGEQQYERLQNAAEMVGMKPTQLARALILGGTRRVLYEHGRLEP